MHCECQLDMGPAWHLENPRIPKHMEAEQNEGLEDQIDAGEITPLISGWNKKIQWKIIYFRLFIGVTPFVTLFQKW